MDCLNQAHGENWSFYQGDCCELIRGLPDESIDFSIFSPPFASIFSYSDSERDMGNCLDYRDFFNQFRFLVKGLYRVLKPGRLISVHCMNLPTTKQHHGEIGIQDFRGDLVRAFVDDEAADVHAAVSRIRDRISVAAAAEDYERAANLSGIEAALLRELEEHESEKKFVFHSEVCIWKDPVTAMQRTKALGLLHKQVLKDSCMSRQGIPDYVVTFRKPGANENPVSGPFDTWIGDDTFENTGNKSIDIWQRLASPVWMDIRPNRTLQYTTARDENDERHICPLALDVVERCLELWSNPGDTVLSPFGGIGTEPHAAILAGRKAIGFELKESYFRKAVENCQQAEASTKIVERKLF